MDISVIVPVYNVAEYIEECIQSLCNQNFLGKYEVILIDDCGTDHSIELAESILSSQNSCHWQTLHHTVNRGLSAARNSGMDAAQGEYVFFVDSDDWLSPDCLQLLYDKALETKSNVVAGAYETFGEGIKPEVFGQIGGYVMAWNKLCRRSFLVGHGIRFIEGLIHEDNPWNLEVTLLNDRFSTVETVTYHYRIRENSLKTDRDYQKHFDAYCRILQAHSEMIERHQFTNMEDYMEQQKALYFTMTQEQGTSAQLHQLYHLIRQIQPLPQNLKCKADFHYLLPESLGYWAYWKFHRYHLC